MTLESLDSGCGSSGSEASSVMWFQLVIDFDLDFPNLEFLYSEIGTSMSAEELFFLLEPSTFFRLREGTLALEVFLFFDFFLDGFLMLMSLNVFFWDFFLLFLERLFLILEREVCFPTLSEASLSFEDLLF